MASPQKEDGHSAIANELLDAIIKTYFSSTEHAVFWAIVRKTYGWHKKTDRISYTQFEKMTGINRRHIAPALKRLILRNIITQIGNGQNLEYGIQKDYEAWLPLPKQVTDTVTQTGNGRTITQTGNGQPQPLPKQVTEQTITDLSNTPLPKQVTEPLPKQVITKEKKETIQKKYIYTPIFEFWNSKNIIKHKKLVPQMETAIKSALKHYSENEIRQAIENYANILHHPDTRWTYVWTLSDFLKRGIEKFLDYEIAKMNYLNQPEDYDPW